MVPHHLHKLVFISISQWWQLSVILKGKQHHSSYLGLLFLTAFIQHLLWTSTAPWTSHINSHGLTWIYIYIHSWGVFSTSSAMAEEMGPVKIFIIAVKKIPSVFISWAKCESAYHPSWAAYKGHFWKVKDRSCMLSWHRSIVALHPFFCTASNIYFFFQTSLKCTSSTYNICRFYWFSPVFTIRECNQT